MNFFRNTSKLRDDLPVNRESVLNSKHQKQVAFQAFVHEHQAPLRGFLRMLGVSSDSVDDLAQETFMIAYRELDRFDENRDFGKWLRG